MIAVRGVRFAKPSSAERGSIALEVAMIAPGLLLILALIFAYGRTAQVNGLLESGTRDAARTATIARSAGEAEQRATAAINESLTDAPTACRASLRVELIGNFTPGEPITVRARCSYSLSDLGPPGAPGTVRTTSSFTSMLDPYRGVD